MSGAKQSPRSVIDEFDKRFSAFTANLKFKLDKHPMQLSAQSSILELYVPSGKHVWFEPVPGIVLVAIVERESWWRGTKITFFDTDGSLRTCWTRAVIERTL